MCSHIAYSRYIYVFLFSLLGLAWSVLGHYTYTLMYSLTHAHNTLHIHTYTIVIHN